MNIKIRFTTKRRWFFKRLHDFIHWKRNYCQI